MNTLWVCIFAAFVFTSYVSWSADEITDRNNRIQDLQEKCHFLQEHRSNYTTYLLSCRSSLERTDRRASLALHAITRELGEIRDELNAGYLTDRNVLIFWIDGVFEMSVDATIDIERGLLSEEDILAPKQTRSSSG